MASKIKQVFSRELHAGRNRPMTPAAIGEWKAGQAFRKADREYKKDYEAIHNKRTKAEDEAREYRESMQRRQYGWKKHGK